MEFKKGDILTPIKGEWDYAFTLGKNYEVIYVDGRGISFKETDEGIVDEYYENQGRFLRYQDKFKLVARKGGVQLTIE